MIEMKKKKYYFINHTCSSISLSPKAHNSAMLASGRHLAMTFSRTPLKENFKNYL